VRDLNAINETLNSIEGSVTSFHIQDLLKQKAVKARIHPALIKLQHVGSLIREEIKLPTGTQLQNIEIPNGPDFISYSAGDKIVIKCNDCSFGTRQPLAIQKQGADGNTSETQVVAILKKFVKAYRVSSFHPAFAPIETSSLKEEFVEAVPYTELVEDISTLKFFRTNKPIRSGEILRSADLKAENLVRAGARTEVLIENEMLRLKTTGLSRSNGAWGEFVEVFHQERNKKYQGKVIDLNKVLVEL
jgi:flagella basal body P-ring formation protein FlgA